MLISLPVGYINLEFKIESWFVCGVQRVAKYRPQTRKKNAKKELKKKKRERNLWAAHELLHRLYWKMPFLWVRMWRVWVI